jgi:hypothetical protein
MSNKITARCIMQIAGRPIEPVEKALSLIVEKLKENKAMKVIEEDISPPELDEESNLYSGIIELLIKFDDLQTMLGYISDFTPNSIEIEDPSEIKLDNVNLTEALNDMSTQLLKTNLKLRKAESMIFSLNKRLRETQENNK